MKKLKVILGIMAIALVTLTVFSCKDTKKSDDSKNENHMEMNDSTINHSDDENMEMNHQNMQNDNTMDGSQKSSKISAILDNYLQIKNALVADDTEKAATAGKNLYTAFDQFDSSSIVEAQKKEVNEILDAAREHAEHISGNSGKMEHQREHFEILSKDVEDLIAITGTDRKLYQTFCPMYNNKKGAIWLSEYKEVKNPYYGSKMMTCGTVKKEI
ncbi:MAG: hypothetical protein APF83_07405 [Lutibacter sp. BRH_c52]|nr:MAG: hypothetical protein APF83_07405 [Lutibacter sp. BRH_c52]HCE54244.1 hypothetical protein [Lutibacter sp.]